MIPLLHFFRLVMACVMTGVMAGPAAAADEAAGAGGPGLEAIRSAVGKSLPLLVKGAQGSMENRPQCFTCHSQALPVLALTTARTRGFAVDAGMLRQQLEFTAGFLEKNRSRYLEGKGQGGQADTAGSALWTLENGGWKPDATTAAVAAYLLVFDQDSGHWKPQSRRPPTEQSLFTSTHLALRGLKTFGTTEQRGDIDRRFDRVRQWLLQSPAQDTEDRVSRLRALQVAGVPPEEVRRATRELLQTQGADGGWAQQAAMASDAYATGTALAALHEAGGLATGDPAYRKGMLYLIAHQGADGSWHVPTRSEPIQSYYESGYPHGKDQFISISAASWATTALALALEVSPVKTE